MTVATDPYKPSADGDAPSASEKRGAAIDFYKKAFVARELMRFPATTNRPR